MRAINAARIISMNLPRTLAFGSGCAEQCRNDLAELGKCRVFIVTSTATLSQARSLGVAATIWDSVNAEPSVQTFRDALSAARDARADAVVGFGGGSAMDVAKLVAAFLDNKQDVTEAFGIGKLAGRSTWLGCLPTTAGTGSEVSPNAILLDESDQLKKGVISPHLMPDAAYVDPMLTLSVPPAVTGATGLDALTHCIEAYANKFSHPMIDLYALKGIELIAKSLKRAYDNGQDIDARTDVALGSMYGGICLGPVNTGAVHALSYPLGGEFHVPHGVANAVLLPHVIEFNLPAAPERYAKIALAFRGSRSEEGHRDMADKLLEESLITQQQHERMLRQLPERVPETDLEIATHLLAMIRRLLRDCGIPVRLSDLGIPEDAIPRMARQAMTVTRLLDRNVRNVTLEDAVAIYQKAF
jgi:alcohol dehydrogenase